MPPSVLTARERTWLQEEQERKGLEPVRLVALAADGRVVCDPDVPAIETMLTGLAKGKYLLLQRLTGHDEGDCFLQVLLADDATFLVEHRTGTTAERRRTRSVTQAEAHDAVLRWALEPWCSAPS